MAKKGQDDRLAEISFQGAIALTGRLLDQMAADQLSAADVEYAVGQLVKTQNGARGFFVGYLTDERFLAVEPSAAVRQAIAAVPSVTVELLVKNLVMAAAMALTHERQGNGTMADSSRRTSAQSANLLRGLLDPQTPTVARSRTVATLAAMAESVRTGAGEYAEFLEKWGYDEPQRRQMASAIAPLHATDEG